MFPDKPPHLSALGDPRGPLARMLGVGAVIVAVAVGLLLYAGRSQGSDAGPPQPDGTGTDTTSADLASAPASLWVDASSSGAAVFVDGDSLGVVPLWVDGLEYGLRRVQVVARDGQTLADTTVSVLAGYVIDLDFGGAQRRPAETFAAATTTDRSEAERATPVTRRPEPAARSASRSSAAASPPARTTTRTPSRPAPRPAPRAEPEQADTGELRITSSPAGAGVRLDGRAIGVTPLTVGGVAPGSHDIAVGTVGYETAAQTVEVRRGQLSEASVQLRPAGAAASPSTEPPRTRPDPPPSPRSAPEATGTVEVLVRPWGRIVIDGATHQRETDVVYRTVLSAGEHRVTASHPQLGSVTRTITVPADGTLRVEFDLARDGS